MKRGIEDARQQLELITPYVKFLRREVMRGDRIKRRAELGTHEPNKPELCFPGEVGGHEITLFQAPLTDQQRIDKIRKELKLIAESAKYDGTGTSI